jgi:hypothetical protein
LGRYEMWQRHGGRGAHRPTKIMHSDDIPEEFYLVMAQDMLLRHRGDATDEVVRVLPSWFYRVQVLSRRAPRKSSRLEQGWSTPIDSETCSRWGSNWHEKRGSSRNDRRGSGVRTNTSDELKKKGAGERQNVPIQTRSGGTYTCARHRHAAKRTT